jgi:hypothetical protein
MPALSGSAANAAAIFSHRHCGSSVIATKNIPLLPSNKIKLLPCMIIETVHKPIGLKKSSRWGRRPCYFATNLKSPALSQYLGSNNHDAPF